jgi:predicted nucleic acid-binding protein
LLQSLFGRILIPSAVYHEIVARGAGRPGAAEVAQAEWIETVAIKDYLALRTLKLTLGAGESEAIVLASEQAADFIILDDWRARRVALELDLPVVGTVAILDKAVEKGLLPALPASLEELRRVGFRFSLKS